MLCSLIYSLIHSFIHSSICELFIPCFIHCFTPSLLLSFPLRHISSALVSSTFTGNWIATGTLPSPNASSTGATGATPPTTRAFRASPASLSAFCSPSIASCRLLHSQEFSIRTLRTHVLCRFLRGERVTGVRCGSGITSFKYECELCSMQHYHGRRREQLPDRC